MFYLFVLGFLFVTVMIPTFIVIAFGGAYSSIIFLILILLLIFIVDYIIDNIVESAVKVIAKIDRQQKVLVISLPVSILSGYLAAYFVDSIIENVRLNHIIYLFLSVWLTMVTLFVDKALDEDGNFIKRDKNEKQ